MKLQNIYSQTDDSEIKKLISDSKTCLLVTGLSSSRPQFGVFNPILLNEKIYLHHSIKDEQVAAMRGDTQCKLIFQDILGVLPSHWVDKKYAGAATTYYRYAELTCSVRLIESPSDQVEYLVQMMKHFQPEGKFESIDYQSSVYQKKLESILIAEFVIDITRAKWKLGQNRPVETRKEVAMKFKSRGDVRCADEIERWIERHGEN